MNKLLLLVITCLIGGGINYASAQEEAFTDISFLIIHSSKNYGAALQVAKEASSKLGIEINLRGYYQDEEFGLKTDVPCDCGEVHGYTAHGRYDDGDYISIEYSDSYPEFTKGLYIVIVASGGKQDLTATLSEIKGFYSDAYIKTASIYVGCMH
jgi:hypothetical protein